MYPTDSIGHRGDRVVTEIGHIIMLKKPYSSTEAHVDHVRSFLKIFSGGNDADSYDLLLIVHGFNLYCEGKSI